MLSPEISKRLDRLLATHTVGFFTQDEFAEYVGHLVTAENLRAVLDRLPPDLHAAVKRGIRLDNQRTAGNECLRPEASPFDWPIFSEYFRNVAHALLEPDAPNRRGIISVVCLPSFDAEWALRLLGSKKMGYTLVLTIAEKPIWSSQVTLPITTKRNEAPLESKMSASLSEVWRKMLLRVRHPESVEVGKDGVTYHFAYHGPEVGVMAGKTWSPSSQTAPGKLVALSQLLRRYVEHTETGRRELVGEIRQSVRWFSELT